VVQKTAEELEEIAAQKTRDFYERLRNEHLQKMKGKNSIPVRQGINYSEGGFIRFGRSRPYLPGRGQIPLARALPAVLKPLGGQLVKGALGLGGKGLKSPFLDIAQDLLYPDPTADDSDILRSMREQAELLDMARKRANFTPDLGDLPYVAPPGKLWRIFYYSANNTGIDGGYLSDDITAFAVTNYPESGFEYQKPRSVMVLLKFWHEPPSGSDTIFGRLADKRTIRLELINRRRPFDIDSTPDLDFPMDVAFPPFRFFPAAPGQPFIEVDPPRGDPRVPMAEQPPPFPTAPRFRPLGSPHWLPWDDPSRPHGLLPDLGSLPPGDNPYPPGPNGLDSLPTNFNSNLSIYQRVTDDYLPEKCMECRFDARVIRDIVTTAKKELLEEIAPTMALPVYEPNTDRIVTQSLKAIGTQETKTSMQRLYKEIAELQNRAHDTAGVLDLIQQLLNNLFNNGTDDEYVDLTVPVVNFNDAGEAVTTSTTISVKLQNVGVVHLLFEVLADARLNAGDSAKVTRIYQILGGDKWFPGGQTTPSISGKFDTEMKTAIESLFDSAGNEKVRTATNLQQLIALYLAPVAGRLGLNDFPATVPKSLLTYNDKDAVIDIKSLTDYLAWYVTQFDALMGQFPIEITIEDTDPLTKGNQTKKIELANISETLAELFGLSTQSSQNSSVGINFLMRLASEVIATKNASLITQDYVKANAAFMGYKGNPKKREINYSFNPTKLDTLDEFLQESKGYITGWDEEDKESIVAYLQKIVFSAGIIKQVFMRSPKQLDILRRELLNMANQASGKDDKEWRTILDFLNDPNGFFNRGDGPLPKVKDKDELK
jgi:hypothetical protein